MAVETDFDPTDLQGRQERDEERQQRRLAAALESREDLVWLLSGRRGRRKVRRELLEAGFDVRDDRVQPTFDRHHGEMCFREGLRFQGMRLLWPIMRLAASGGLPLESFQKLFQEIDE